MVPGTGFAETGVNAVWLEAAKQVMGRETGFLQEVQIRKRSHEQHTEQSRMLGNITTYTRQAADSKASGGARTLRPHCQRSVRKETGIPGCPRHHGSAVKKSTV